MAIEWKARYEVGIIAIDNQHKYLVSLINRLEDSNGHENEFTEIHDIFFELVNYTKYHLKRKKNFLSPLNTKICMFIKLNIKH
jgi:hemerythrin-like metal-binding protein